MIKRMILAYCVGLSLSYGCSYYDCTGEDDTPIGCDSGHSGPVYIEDDTQARDTCYVAMRGAKTLFNRKCFTSKDKAWDAIYKAYPSENNYNNFKLLEVNHAL